MGVSYAGQNLLLEDPEGQIQDWLDEWLTLDDGRMIVDWPTGGKFENLAGTSAACYSGQSLPCLNYSRPLRPKLNTWYQPTGASRWGYGLYLCTFTQLQAITAQLSSGATGSGYSHAPLILTYYANGINYQRGFEAYMLPPHPISVNGTDPNGFWIVPLVDLRYYWQFVSFALGNKINNATPGAKTWANFLTDFVTASGSAIFGGITADTVNGNYLAPNYFFLNGAADYAKAPMVFDLMSHSVGQRLVANYQVAARGVANNFFSGNNWQCINSTTSLGILGNNLQYTYDPGQHQSGTAVGTTAPGFSSLIPTNIAVYFRAWNNGIVNPDWMTSRYVISVSAVSVGFTGATVSTTKVFLSTALADFTAGGGNPTNLTNLTNLATQIATDFYNYASWIQDQNVVGISQWQETGFDDYIEFDIGSWCKETETYRAKTRIHSTPYNFNGSELQFQYDSSVSASAVLWEFGDKITGTLDGNIAAGGTQTISITAGDGPFPGGGTYHLTITSIGTAAGSSGDTVVAFRQANQWILPPSSSATIKMFTGTTSTVVLAGNSGTFVLSGAGGSQTVLVRYGAAIPGATYLIAQTTAGYECVNPDRMLQCKPTTVQVAGGSVTTTLYSGTQGSEASLATNVTAWVRAGAVITTKVYNIRYAENGWEIDNPDLLFQCQCSAVTPKGNSVSSTLFAGTAGSETSLGSPGAITAWLRTGIVITSKTYLCSWKENGWEIDNPDLIFHGRLGSGNAAVGNQAKDFTIYTGTPGSETTTSVTAPSCYIRNGLVIAGKTYIIDTTENGYEVRSDTWAIVKNLTGSDIAKAGTGTVTILSGTAGSETTTGVTITALARWGAFKNNAIGRVVVDNTTNTISFTLDSTDSC